MRRLQRPQPRLIFDPHRAVHVGAALKQPEHQRHLRLGVDLAMKEVGVAGVQQRYVAALPPSHPLTLKERLRASDLADAAMIDRCHCEQSAFFVRTATARRRSAAIAESEDWAMALVAAGIGIAIVPEGVARGHADVAVREIDVDVKREVGLAYSAAGSLPQALQDFVARLKPRRPKVRRARTIGKARR